MTWIDWAWLVGITLAGLPLIIWAQRRDRKRPRMHEHYDD